METNVPYRIETERLVIRCPNPEDAEMAQEAILNNLDHLSPWLPWTDQEPQSLAERIALLRSFRSKFDAGEDFVYGIFNPRETQMLGSTGLHTRRGTGIFEIGYWIDADHLNQGLATESTSALIKAAFEIADCRRVEIRCDPENVVSARIPRKLGFQMEGTLRHRDLFRGKPRDTQVWGLLADEYPDSPASKLVIKAYDAVGKLLS